uniref:Ankyrin repeat, SAM and basic leucine zipper domain containing 1 n=1 Tax=Oncorhynchus mykiss TaxID=8022 RepID=A0A8C7R8A5_ONCMY
MLHLYFCSVYIDTLSPSIELPGCRGLDVKAKLGFEWTPLMCAVHVAHYDIAKLLLDIGASSNFDQYTVLMAACMASAREDKMVKCVELLLSRNADQHIQQVRDCVCVSRMTSLILVSRDGYNQVINLLVSHGAEVNSQDENGYTVRMVPTSPGVMPLGSDKTKAGKIAADTAKVFKRPQFFKRDPDPPSASKRGEHGLTSVRLTIPRIPSTLLNHIGGGERIVVKEIHLDRVDLDTLSQFENINSGYSTNLNVLISLRQQRCCLTETVSTNSLPLSNPQLVLSLDPKEEAQAICNELVARTGDLQKEVTCLRNLLHKVGIFFL